VGEISLRIFGELSQLYVKGVYLFMKITVLWVVTLCSSADRNRSLAGNSCVYFGGKIHVMEVARVSSPTEYYDLQ
jgi:hypothetical protein